MAKILMGWEIGGGLGHLAQLKAIARHLTAAGHELVYVVRSLHGVDDLFGPDTVEARLAPRWTGRERFGDRNFVTATLADVMAFAGFRDEETIGAIMRGWDEIIAEIKPDLILGEAAPALWLAARGRIPTVAIGNGVMMPPSDLPELPEMSPDTPRRFDQREMVASVNRAQKGRGGPAIEALPEMFAGDATFVLNLPILDPYGEVRSRPSDGPMEALPAPAKFPGEVRVFAYLGVDHPMVENFYRGLVESQLPALLYVRGATDEQAGKLSLGPVKVVNKPQPMTEVTRASRVIVHYGGTGTVTSALAIGRPQLVMPIALERQLNADRVAKLGVGARMRGKRTPAEFAETLRALAERRDFHERSLEIARQIAAAGYRDQAPVIAAACESLLGG